MYGMYGASDVMKTRPLDTTLNQSPKKRRVYECVTAQDLQPLGLRVPPCVVARARARVCERRGEEGRERGGAAGRGEGELCPPVRG